MFTNTFMEVIASAYKALLHLLSLWAQRQTMKNSLFSPPYCLPESQSDCTSLIPLILCLMMTFHILLVQLFLGLISIADYSASVGPDLMKKPTELLLPSVKVITQSASQPVSQSASQPVRQPASQPTSQPASKPPNP